MRTAQRLKKPVGEEGLSRGLSHVFLVLGLALTAFVAVLQQSNAAHERQLKFDAASAHVQEDLANAVSNQIQDFRSGVNFIAATHPGPIDEYQAFFTREVKPAADNDPGVLFLEFAATDEVEELISRERELGNDDITLTLLPSTASQRVIVTRLARPTEVFDLPLLGLDVTAMQRELFPEDLGPEAFELFVVESSQLASFVNEDGFPDPNYADYDQYIAVLVGAVTTQDGSLLGYTVYFQTVTELLESVTDQDLNGLSVELYAVGIDEPMAGRLSPNAPDIDAADLKAVRELATTSVRWRIEVWADADFGPSTSLLDQTWIWIVGILATVGIYAASIRRQRNQQHLDTARFELAHAMTLAQTDALTGLLNRNGLVEAARLCPIDRPATVFFIDLDGFKAVNDNEGHEKGDQVLRAVAGELRQMFRSEDLVSRLGGDEFVVFSEHCGSSDYIRTVSSRINQAVSRIDDRVTCSLGVASRRQNEPVDVKDLIRAADSAMYEAKRSGGDRFTIGGAGVSGAGFSRGHSRGFRDQSNDSRAHSRGDRSGGGPDRRG